MRFTRKKRHCGQGGHNHAHGWSCGGGKQTNLSCLGKGQKGVVSANKAKGQLKQKLLNMGVIPGAEIQMIRNAPLRDPIEIGVQNYLITLRHAEAELIEVETK